MMMNTGISDKDESSSSTEDENEEGPEEFWDDDERAKQSTTFSQADLDLVYGKNRAPKFEEKPALLKATINLKTFGKSETLASRDSRSILPRLKSIHLDATSFVSRVRSSFPTLPALANLRNGLWYFERNPDGECRFRSTDGHSRSWSFFISRANLPCAVTAVAKGGVLLVDSTRSGKQFPDSFNRTVPLWCCLLNRAVGSNTAQIDLPPWVPETERYAISDNQLNQWTLELRTLMEKSSEAQQLLNAAIFFRPFWIANDASAWGIESAKLSDLVMHINSISNVTTDNHIRKCIPVICISASAVVQPEDHREHFSWSYVPGAADDEENWAMGLTPKLFWQHCLQLLNTNNSEECATLVRSLTAIDDNASQTPGASVPSKQYVDINELLRIEWFDGDVEEQVSQLDTCLSLTWVKGEDKSWSRRYPDVWQKKILPEGLERFSQYLNKLTAKEPGTQVPPFSVIASNIETSITMCLAIVACFADDNLQIVTTSLKTSSTALDKQVLRAREGAIIAKCPAGAVIPRRLFKEVAEYFAPKLVT